MTTAALLELRQVACGYNRTAVVRNIQFQIARGEIACLLGPSGCGKSTLLRAIAGFEPLIEGEIVLDGVTLSSPAHTVEPPQRRCAMVFQDLALFPHLTVGDNVRFGIRNVVREQADDRVREHLTLVGMHEFANRHPHELSGGQQQRVALARALAPEPEILLLDEPFSSLDTDLRARLGLEVRDLLKARQTTAILVTHDQQEAFTMADQIGVINQGHLIQWATPYALYHEPSDRFVANFVGQGCLVPGTLESTHTVATALGCITGPRAYSWAPGTALDVLIRPDDIVYAPDSPLRARVINRAFKGAEILYTLRTETVELLSSLPSHIDIDIGHDIGITLDAQHVVAFLRHAETGA
jgi:iron(III) transport system ATP-binding protein